MTFKKILLFLLVTVFAFSLAGCGSGENGGDGTKTVDTGINDTYTLILQSQTMDGVLNPFFYSNANDEDVLDLVYTGLLTLDPTAKVVAGDDYPTAAKDYSIYYTDDLTTYAPKETYENGDYVVYDIVLKNGDKFSDGTDITAEDVLFNYYTYLDPAYDGSSTLYTLPILGLQDFRTQVVNSELYTSTIAAIVADDVVSGRGTTYPVGASYSEADFNRYWTLFFEAGETFAQEIVDAVLASYLTDDFVQGYFDPTLTAAEVEADQGLSVAYGMSMWGFGSISEDLTTFTGASGTEYVVADLNAATYFDEILRAYEDENGKVDYAYVADFESAGSNFFNAAQEGFLSAYAEVGSVPSISGLVKGTTTIDNEEYETIKVVLTGQNPKAILSLGVIVAPEHYYNAGYTYKTDSITNYGVEFDSPEYMAHLKSFNSAPMGAGPYVYDRIDEGDGTVYFERNNYFETTGGENVYNANINKVALKIVDTGIYDALDAGDIHYGTVDATSDVMDSIGSQNKLTSILVDNLGYGYICINPEIFPNLNERIALTTVFDLSQVLEYYPSGLADIIYRGMSQVSWAYPEGAQAIYPYDETLASAIQYFKAAGYSFDEASGKFVGTQENPLPEYEFYIPSEASEHPAGGIFLKAKDLLATIGITANLVVDQELIADIKAGPIGIYALAWEASADPDMFQVYHYQSQATSVLSNGVVWLHDNGDDDSLGTIQVTKLDGTVVTMNQKQALDYLAELIEEGVKYLLAEERKPIYEKALEVLAQLNIELPTYQRKNLFVFDGTVIDSNSLSTTVTPYWGPIAEIWKVKFVEGTPGNQTVEQPAN